MTAATHALPTPAQPIDFPQPTGLLVLVCSQVVLPNHPPQAASIIVDRASGKIKDVLVGELLAEGEEMHPALAEDKEVEWVLVDEGKVVVPGLVDAHVHLNQPGRTSWEGFTSGTLAAVSGGVTTVIDMPLNSIPSTTSVGALEVKIKAARYGWENWRSLEEAQRVLGGNPGAKHKSGMGVGAGWGKGRIDESDAHKHEDHDGDVDLEEALEGMSEVEMLDDSDEEMALFNEDDPVPIRRMSRSNSRSNSTVGLSALAPSTPINGTISLNGTSNGAHRPSADKRSPRLLDVLGSAQSFVGKNKGVWCDVGFWGGIVPGNKRHLVPLVKAGVKGFKCFLIESGVDEFPAVSEEDVRRAMKALNTTPEGGLILFHAEMGDPVHGLGTDQSYTTFLQSRPDQWECTAIEMIIRLLSEQARDPSVMNPTRAHIVHLSSALALPMIREARKAGLPLTVETCFHYLVLSSNSVPGQHDPHRQSTEYKCCPPIRDESNREALWAALEDGSIDYVVSDHSPCLPEMKAGGFMDAWGGISALGLGFSLLWTEVTRRNKLKASGQLDGQEIGIERIVKWCCENTAEQVGLAGVKGVVHPGADADFAIFNPEIFFEITTESLKFKNKVSPYLGKTLRGKVEQTFLRGNLVFDHKKGLTQQVRLGNLI
ncbi:hypothetical protein QFC24_000584 [Naganishia onofrii]|uniref:Uncharacterized protein n=1 Tax=Naganishia onofrii TaxID=1851511 RepID=A0ACC2XY29_9TREE|nr:hypothetical protein QFC24_000584 [Naganishia onofrii]